MNRRGDLSSRYHLEMKRGLGKPFFPRGILTGPSPKEELEKLELDAARTSHRVLFLPNMAKLALWAGDTDKAERYASEALHSIAGT
jgi:hypothetical protein